MKMKKILDKYLDCNMFSLSCNVSNELVTEDDYNNAVNKVKEKLINKLKKSYDKNINCYPKFEILYQEIEQECKEFCSKNNQKKVINNFFDKNRISEMKKMGMNKKEIDNIINNFFSCRFIADKVGESTKYGKENENFFWHFYNTVGQIIDYQNKKDDYINTNGINPINQIPNELKKKLIKYEILFYNSVTTCNRLMINYYFILDAETKKYLLKYKTDFDLDDLEDLAMFKNNKLLFYSCTHEQYNSLES